MRPSRETVVTLGETLVAISPETPTGLHRAPVLRMHPGRLRDALTIGAHAGARAVEVTGEHAGCPRLDELPADLWALL